jgi:hypothetical protein
MSVPVEITVFTKDRGPLTKQISLAPDGSVKSDGSACVMSKGAAHRFRFDCMPRLGELLVALKPNEAFATGSLRPDLPDHVEVVTKNKLNGAHHRCVIARTQDFVIHRAGEQEIVLLDFDRKGMPPSVAAKIEASAGFWPALVSVLPALANVARVERASTSAGLFNALTGAPFPYYGGIHDYVLIKDGADAERFLKTLHERCWLHGYGWMMVGAGGQLLERSIVDRVCGTPERLIFGGQPVLVEPVAQDRAVRQPIISEGEALDTRETCLPLTLVELAKLQELRAKEKHRLAGESAKAREKFIADQSRRLADRTGIELHRARRAVERQCEGVLLPDVELLFDNEEFEGKTVADVLADPARFEGETLADPLEGVEYGRCKARIMRRSDGSVWINSFAHGRTVYELKYDYGAVKAALERTPKDEIADLFVRLALEADLDDDEVENLRNITSEESGITKTALGRKLKNARQEAAVRVAQQEHDRHMAERRDPRPQLPAPPADAEWLPRMEALNEVIGASGALEPPARNPNRSRDRRNYRECAPVVGSDEVLPVGTQAIAHGDAGSRHAAVSRHDRDLPKLCQPIPVRHPYAGGAGISGI